MREHRNHLHKLQYINFRFFIFRVRLEHKHLGLCDQWKNVVKSFFPTVCSAYATEIHHRLHLDDFIFLFLEELTSH